MSHNDFKDDFQDDKDALLVDYLEGELDEVRSKGIWILLKHSDIDRKIVTNLQRTREVLQNFGEIEVPDEQEYYLNLEERVMGAVDRAAVAGSEFKTRSSV